MENQRTTWSDLQIKQLLAIRAESDIAQQFDGTVRDSVMYERIALELLDRGIQKTRQQVNSKLKSLKSQYFRVVEHNKKSKCDALTWVYYNECDAIWGARRNVVQGSRPVRGIKQILQAGEVSGSATDATAIECVSPGTSPSALDLNSDDLSGSGDLEEMGAASNIVFNGEGSSATSNLENNSARDSQAFQRVKGVTEAGQISMGDTRTTIKREDASSEDDNFDAAQEFDGWEIAAVESGDEEEAPAIRTAKTYQPGPANDRSSSGTSRRQKRSSNLDRSKDNIGVEDTIAEARNKRMRPESPKIVSPTVTDEDEQFFRAMIPMVSKLPPRLKAQVKYQIYGLIHEAEMQVLDSMQGGS